MATLKKHVKALFCKLFPPLWASHSWTWLQRCSGLRSFPPYMWFWLQQIRSYRKTNTRTHQDQGQQEAPKEKWKWGQGHWAGKFKIRKKDEANTKEDKGWVAELSENSLESGIEWLRVLWNIDRKVRKLQTEMSDYIHMNWMKTNCSTCWRLSASYQGQCICLNYIGVQVSKHYASCLTVHLNCGK